MARKGAHEFVVTDWLVLGSFAPTDSAQTLRCSYLPESELAPSPGERVARREWKHVRSAGVVDLLALGFEPSQFCAAYAFTYIRAPKPGPARLLMGADDGLAVWLNGVEVWRNDRGRSHTPGEDVCTVALNGGWNRLLLKISQHVGGWAFSCSVESAAGLAFSLRNPLPRQWKGPPRAGRIGIEGVRLADRDSGPGSAVRVDLRNDGAKPVTGVRLALASPAGGESVAADVARVEAFGCASVLLRAEPAALAVTMADPAVRLVISHGKVRTEHELPADVPARLLVAWALGSRADAAEAARLLSLCVETHGLSWAALGAEARAGLAALAAGDPAAAAGAIRVAVDTALAAVKDRKAEAVHVVGHAHIDMNWLWTWPETVKTCHDTFRQVIAFMEEFPDFCFLQSQTTTYRAVESLDPPLFEKIRQRVREGRWEIAGGMETEGDTNLSGGEALARSFLLAQRYFLSRFGKAACVGWLPDNFGHISQLPQMLRLAGCEFFYFHRCRPHYGTFWWEGPDGSRVLCYSNDTYNGRVRPALAAEIEKVVPGTKRLLEVCGVGDHGGGPTRRDIIEAHRLDATPRFPSVRFSTAEQFFRRSLSEMAGRPVHKGEMQYIFEGCYTSIARVKEGNRRCETALYAAELLAALRGLAGADYPAQSLRRAWEIVTFNQFHDILCGSAIHESNADSVADYKWAASRAQWEADRALRALADEVAFRPEAGQPVVVFNPQPRARKALIEAELYTHELPASVRLSGWAEFYGAHKVRPPAGGDAVLPTVTLRDAGGRAIPAQIVWGKQFPPGYRSRVLFVADLPAGGYRTFYADMARPDASSAALTVRRGRVETDAFRVAFDLQTGDIRGLYDKRTRREYVRRGGAMNRLRVFCEAPHGMSAWNLGRVTREEDVADVVRVAVVENGPVRVCVEAEKRWGRSRFVQRTYVYRSYPRIDFELEAHWFEQGNASEEAPMLRVLFPLALPGARFDCQVPCDVVPRPATGREVPVQQWADVSDGRAGVALLNRGKYGYSFDGRELRLTLLRSSYDPDIYPDQGLHRIAYSLFPHAGDWTRDVWAEGESFNLPPLASEPPSGALGRPGAARGDEASLIGLEPAGVVLSGIKRAEEGDELVVRLVEIAGRSCTALLKLPAAVKAARRLDLIERPLAGVAEPVPAAREVRVAVRPHEIVTLGLRV